MKKNLPLILLFLGWELGYSQGIASKVRNIWQKEIAPLWGVGLAIIFVVSFLLNSGYFFGENRDIKTGITRVLTYVLIAVIATTLVGYLLNLTI